MDPRQPQLPRPTAPYTPEAAQSEEEGAVGKGEANGATHRATETLLQEPHHQLWTITEEALSVAREAPFKTPEKEADGGKETPVRTTPSPSCEACKVGWETPFKSLEKKADGGKETPLRTTPSPSCEACSVTWETPFKTPEKKADGGKETPVRATPSPSCEACSVTWETPFKTPEKKADGGKETPVRATPSPSCEACSVTWETPFKIPEEKADGGKETPVSKFRYQETLKSPDPEEEKQLIVQKMKKLIEAEVQNSVLSPVFQESMQILTSLSQTKPALNSWEKRELVGVCVKGVFSWSEGPSWPGLDLPNSWDVQTLPSQTLGTLAAMLEAFFLEEPSPAELQNILEVLGPWLTASRLCARAQAVACSVFLLYKALRHPLFLTHSEFPGIGLLLGRLLSRVSDPDREIGSKALDGICVLYTILELQKKPRLAIDCSRTELCESNRMVLGPYNPTSPCQNILKVVAEFGDFLGPQQVKDLLLASLEGLQDRDEDGREDGDQRSELLEAMHLATEVTLSSMLEWYLHRVEEVIPDMIQGIHLRLSTVHEPRAREVVLLPISLLAGSFLTEVVIALLMCPLPLDSHGAEMWRQLVAHKPSCDIRELLELLLTSLKEKPVTGPGQESIVPLAAASGLCEVLGVHSCLGHVRRLYPQLLLALLIQVHYHIDLSLPGWVVSQHQGQLQSLQALFTPVCWVVKVVKSLLLRMGCRYEATLLEKQGGWDHLTLSTDHHRGVGLLARAMVQYSCQELLRFLYLLVPLLERGDHRHKVTAMAFFVELLRLQQARRIPDVYALHRLQRALEHADPVMHVLSVRGFALLIHRPRERAKVQELLPAMVKGLAHMDGSLVVEAVANLHIILKTLGWQGASGPVYLDTVLILKPLFRDVRENVRSDAIELLGKVAKLPGKLSKTVLEEQLRGCLVPLLLHLQEGSPALVKRCKQTMSQCSRLMGWELPRKVNSTKPWHDHQQIVADICQFLVRTFPGSTLDFLSQSQEYTRSPLHCLRRAAVIFIGFLVPCMDTLIPNKVLAEVKEELEALRRDPEASVCIFAAQAQERIVSSSWRASWPHPHGDTRPSEPAVSHRWNPSYESLPVSHRSHTYHFSALKTWRQSFTL
ncbi:maestro heat-like repeat-containing protein family member 7 isoform X2 [Ornithorhynchus anatinus]|uniref:maestro heat-like repeat-containing protein family member 7 isoform X2 n=1 Tax=Ornithorhynchus anatinus TaxID=9258 RepID=UPI0019D45730|nr:maestro heat-like repeat-containing protein family member 7 isoform X2 [Ornithorhynchus anatinus]